MAYERLSCALVWELIFGDRVMRSMMRLANDVAAALTIRQGWCSIWVLR